MDFQLGLITVEDGIKYEYYINEEDGDEDSNTLLYCNGKLICSNIFAHDSFFDTLRKISNGKILDYQMSTAVKDNFTQLVDTFGDETM